MATAILSQTELHARFDDDESSIEMLKVDELIELGGVAERSGSRAKARELYERAIRRLSRGESTRAAMLMRWIGRTFVADGDLDAASDCVGVAMAVSAACQDLAGEGHAINLQGSIDWRRGNLDVAERQFLQAREKAITAHEVALAGMTSQNLGIIANIRGDLGEALHHYRVAIDHYRTVDRRAEICLVLNNSGKLYTDLRRWTEASQAYEEAALLAETLDDVTSRICIEVNRAELAFERGDRVQAEARADNALEMSNRSGDQAWVAQIERLKGILYRDAGKLVEAERSLTQAIALAEAREDLLLVAKTLRAAAELYRRQGRNRETLQSLNRAHRIFTQLTAKRDLATVDDSVTRLEEDFLDIVKRWGESIEAKDLYTQGHCVRVADLSCAIASVSGIEGQALFWFRIGALLHDVGKLAVPSEVLNKPGKLTPEEWDLMRSHPMAGVDLLAGVDFPWDVRPIIESHHERWDGKGYPHGLKGEDIPVSARILAIADVYDALTSVRSYKRAMTHDEAMEIMRRDIGTAFDPECFARFENVVANRTVAPAPVEQPAVTPDLRAIRRPTPVATITGLDAVPTRIELERITAQALADCALTGSPVSIIAVQVVPDARAGATAQSVSTVLLRLIARRLRSLVRSTDFVARSNENQFMVLLAGISADDATGLVGRARPALERVLRNHKINTQRLQLSVVTAEHAGDSANALIAAAEKAIDTRPVAASVGF